MEENELEEGEACSGQEEDACVDPDIALSYIDEKLHDVLGHFQKDFEAGVSAESLGAKFGGYGSFLPAYQRSPSVWSQPRSPRKLPIHSSIRSPFNPSLEGAHQSPSVQMTASISKNYTASRGNLLGNSGKKGASISALSAGVSIPKHDSSNRRVNGSNQNTLKVRIKVGPDNNSFRKNAAIYSGLGLDISPSSPEDSADDSGGDFPELLDVPHESPTTILQTMTCFVVGYLLSPLPGSLLHLTERGNPYLKNCGKDTPPEICSFFDDFSLPVKDVKSDPEMKVKSGHKKRYSIEVKNTNYKDDISTILESEIDIETLAGQELVSNALNIPLLSISSCVDFKEDIGQELFSKSSTISHLSNSRGVDGKVERQITAESAKVAGKVTDHSWESTSNLINVATSSSDLLKKNLFESEESMENNRVVSSGNETKPTKGNQSSKLSLTERPLEERNMIKHKSSDIKKEGKVKIENGYSLLKGDVDEFEGREEPFVAATDPANQKIVQVDPSREQNGEKLLQRKNQLSEGKKKLKGCQTFHTPSVEFLKENLMALSSVSSKEQKKSHVRGINSEAKSKLKSCKALNNGHLKEFQRGAMEDVKTEQVDKTLLELHSIDVSQDMKPENEKSKERQCGKKFDTHLVSEASVKAPVTTTLTCNALVTDTVVAPCVPVVIKDNWVCCDKCQKWRLLPYGTNPDSLPSNWLCSMQTWLPDEMNKCSVSEEETTKAINPQYQPPIPESDSNHYGVGALSTSLAPAQHFDRSLETIVQSALTTVKKKHGLKDTLAAPIRSSHIQLSNSMKKYLQDSLISNDAHPVSLESDPLQNVDFDQRRKSTDFTTVKQKHKHKQKEKSKIFRCSSDGGGPIEQSGRHSKSKSTRELNRDGFRVAKKIKTDGPDCPDEDWHCDPDSAGKSFPNMGSSSSTNVIGKHLEKCKVNCPKESRSNSRGNLPSHEVRSSAQYGVHSDGEVKEYFSASDVEKSDELHLVAKKRKVKEWQDSQGHHERRQQLGDNTVKPNEEFSDSELRKEKKAKVLKSEKNESSKGKKDGGMGKVDQFFGSRGQLVDGLGEQDKCLVIKEHRLVQCQGIVESRQALDGTDSSKRDLSKVQPSTAATSSSSKVSGSRKNKVEFLEARGSPVESVTSSPFRVSNTDKLVGRNNLLGKDDAIDLGFPVMESPKRCSDGEADGRNDQTGLRGMEKASFVQHKTVECNKTRNNVVPDFLRSSFNYQNEAANQLSGGKVKRGIRLKTSGLTNDNLLLIEFGESNVMSSAMKNTLDQHKRYIGEPLDRGIVHDENELHEPTGKVHPHEQVMNQYHKNGSNALNADKSSTFNVKDRSSEYDFECNLKVSDSFSEQDGFYSAYLGKKDDAVGRMDHHLDYGMQENFDNHVPSMISKKHKDSKAELGFAGASCGKSNFQENAKQAPLHEDDKSLNNILSDHIDRSDMATGRGNSESLFSTKNNLERQSQGSHSAPISSKGNKLEVHPTDAAKSAATKVIKPPKGSDNQNVVHYNSTGHPNPNELDARSPVRKDGHTASTVALKEARDLKHMANRLKNEGQELESTGLYFQAALKFLHVASLLEHGEVARSMQMYSDTARLCEFCAHEYERCKEMAAAALAYKCMEVAYFKVAYFKQPVASKDRHELQTALQMVLRGESSPSSSASDVDNLNNQGMFDKAASAKSVSSPQIAGNHVIASRSSYTRWLDYGVAY